MEVELLQDKAGTGKALDFCSQRARFSPRHLLNLKCRHILGHSGKSRRTGTDALALWSRPPRSHGRKLPPSVLALRLLAGAMGLKGAKGKDTARALGKQRETCSLAHLRVSSAGRRHPQLPSPGKSPVEIGKEPDPEILETTEH